MSYEIRTYRPNGSLAMDGYNKAGIYVDTVVVQYADPSGSKVYPQIPAGSMFIVVAGASGGFTPTITDDGLGHAKLVWTYSYTYGNSPIPTEFLVFARKINADSSYDAKVFNNAGDLLMSYNHPVPQYAGKALPATVANANYSTFTANSDSGYTTSRHQATVNLRTQMNRMILLNLPDSTSDDTWYACDNSFIRAGEQANVGGTLTYDVPVNIYVIRYGNSPIKVPSLHVYSLETPALGGDSYGMRLYTATGALMYDSSAENISISDQQPLAYTGSEQSMALNMPAQVGVVIPFRSLGYWTDMPTDINGNTGYWTTEIGAVQRRGNTLRYRMVKIDEYKSVSSGATTADRSGVVTGASVFAVDLAQLAPEVRTGSKY